MDRQYATELSNGNIRLALVKDPEKTADLIRRFYGDELTLEPVPRTKTIYRATPTNCTDVTQLARRLDCFVGTT